MHPVRIPMYLKTTHLIVFAEIISMTLLSFVRNLEGKIQISLFQGAERIQNSISWDALKAYTPPKAASEKNCRVHHLICNSETDYSGAL